MPRLLILIFSSLTMVFAIPTVFMDHTAARSTLMIASTISLMAMFAVIGYVWGKYKPGQD